MIHEVGPENELSWTTTDEQEAESISFVALVLDEVSIYPSLNKPRAEHV